MSVLLTAIAHARNEIRRQVALYRLGKIINKMVTVLDKDDEFDGPFIPDAQAAIRRITRAPTVTNELVERVVEELYEKYCVLRWQLIPL